MLRTVKRAILTALAAPGVTAPFYPLTRGRATVFMLHRFRDADRGVQGDDPALVRCALELLHGRGFEFVALADLFARLRGEGRPLRRAVAFTIDDGYAEQAGVGLPAFGAFDCPVTTFVTTGFLDGRLWFWWDQITWVLRQTRRKRLVVTVAGERLELAWDADAERRHAGERFVARCKTVPESERVAAIGRLASEADVPLPAAPPPEYAPMTWDELRAWEARGMSFGPHTVTHPILSRTDDTQSRREIVDSWTRLRQGARAPVPVFCYPNGGWGDFGVREIATIREAGLAGAVIGEWGIADSRDVRSADPDAAYRVPRIPWSGALPYTVQYVSGVEVAKLWLRGLAGRRSPSFA